jgi:hydrogenase-4 component E
VSSALQAALIVVVLTDLTLLGAQRWRFGIQVVALQGLAVGLTPLLAPGHGVTWAALFVAADWRAWRFVVLAAVAVSLKGVLFPRLLRRALRDAQVREEPAPPVSYSQSLALGVGLLGLATWLGGRLAVPHAPPAPLFLPCALFTMFSGLFLICARSRALTQVLGYLLLENGVYLFGLAVAPEAPLLLEMGTLLDVFLAVLVMGVALFHISRTFDSLDVDQLSALKDTD